MSQLDLTELSIDSLQLCPFKQFAYSGIKIVVRLSDLLKVCVLPLTGDISEGAWNCIAVFYSYFE